MSDDYPAYFAAWTSVMGKPDNRLLCSWHVMHSWKRQLNSVPFDKRETVKKKLRELLEELDEKKFFIGQKSFSNFLIDSSLGSFNDYFVTNYSSRPELWAYCYRKNLGINTNNHLEAMHR